MSYHSATILMTDNRNATRFLWEISTVYHKGATPHKSEAYTAKSEDYKILRWVSNDAVVPKDIMEKITWPHKVAMDVERSVQTFAFLASYTEAQLNRTPDQLAEEAYEMRAAFGTGVKVVNVFTGKRTTT
jgi:hypothetical protein